MSYTRPMIKDAILGRLREQEVELRRLGVESLSLFGSVARDEERDASDIDIAVKLDPALMPRGFAYFGFLADLEERLKKALGRHVDVIPEPAKKPALQREIDRDRVIAF